MKEPTSTLTEEPSTMQVNGLGSQASRLVGEAETTGRAGQGARSAFAVNPDTTFSDLISLVPIFPLEAYAPGSLENPREFSTPVGKAKLHGPLLTEQDQNTFSAMARLHRNLSASASQGSCESSSDTSMQIDCGRVFCSADYVHSELQFDDHAPEACASDQSTRRLSTLLSDSDTTVESIKRLNALRLELELHTRDEFLNLAVTGLFTSIVDVEWQRHRGITTLIYQFPSVVLPWIERVASVSIAK